jgi:fatty acid-binding protein DegV
MADTNGFDRKLERLTERLDGLSLTVELHHADSQAFQAKMDIYIREVGKLLAGNGERMKQMEERMKQIEANHTLLIQLVDGQQSRIARLEDRQ